MSDKICYLGDDHLQGAAAYLAGVMLHHGLAFDHVPSAEPPPPEFAARPYAAYVISDYRASQLGEAAMARIAARVEQGAGLLMIGGWESFHGRLGEYHNSPLAAVLPVEMQSSDDRRNFAQPCLIETVCDHEILAGLPWDQPPGIGGINTLTAKPGAEILLAAVEFSVVRASMHGGQVAIISAAMAASLAETQPSPVRALEGYQFVPRGRAPLLVVGRHGAGRTAALATDVAPHWVGGFVDWGDRRVVQEVGGGMIEVGNWYARFFRNLVAWCGGL